MFKLKKGEIKGIIIIFVFTLLANYWGFKTSFMRERDIQRVLDMGSIESGLIKYFSEYGEYPLSNSEGQIVACLGPKTGVKEEANVPVVNPGYKKPILVNLIPCTWGVDSLWDASDINYPAYISKLPSDPLSQKGIQYQYFSDGKTFRIYSHLELKSTTGYDENIILKKINCGKKICNFGRVG